MTLVEVVTLTLTGAEALTPVNTVVASGDTLTVNQSGAFALTFDGSNESNGYFVISLAGSAAHAITGGDLADTITGGAGDEALIGGAGADSITGSAGVDAMTGGLGADTFTIATAHTGATILLGDTVADFVTGTDFLNLDVAGAAANYSEADGALVATIAAAITAAQLVLDGTVLYYFLYNFNAGGTGLLIYDADGTAGGEDVITLTGGATAAFLALADIT